MLSKMRALAEALLATASQMKPANKDAMIQRELEDALSALLEVHGIRTHLPYCEQMEAQAQQLAKEARDAE